MAWGKEDPQWRKVVNPATGQGFGTWEDYSGWASGQEQAGKASSQAFNTAGNTAAKPAGYGAGEYDWGALKDYPGYTTADDGRLVMGNPMTGTSPTTGSVSIDPRTGTITRMAPDQMYSLSDPRTTTMTSSYDPYADYGMGVPGVIAVNYDYKTGSPTEFYAGTPGGGGRVFGSLTEAQQSADQYATWAKSQGKLPTGSAGAPQPAATASPTGPGYTEPGKLAQPLQGEQFYDSTKGFYTQPTEAHKVWDETKNQPIAAQQHWEGIAGKFSGPSYAENLYGNYKDTFADPNALQGIYDREQERSKVALDARAAAGGWGSSGAAMKAAANLDATFADRRLAAMQGFATTGMGLASAADAGRNEQALTGGRLAESSDKGLLDRLYAAGYIDAGDLQRLMAGQSAASGAQGLTVGRETGALTSGQGIAKDMASLTYSGMSEANATKFLGELNAISMQLQAGNLDYNAAMQKALETAGLMGAASSTALNTIIASKLMGGGASLYNPPATGAAAGGMG